MQRKRFSTVVVSAVLGAGAIALSACSILQPAPMPEPNPNPTPGPTSDQPGTSDPTENPWTALLGDTNLPQWRVEPCEGTAPFLCVYNNAGEQVGTVELQFWTLQERTDLAQALSAAGLDPETIDLQDPAQRSKVLLALETLVSDFYATIEQDWATGYGDAIAFDAESPVEVRVGSQPALLYGFRGIESDGTVQQQSVGYMAFDGDRLYVITTAAPFEEAPGFTTVEQLQVFQPYLDIVAGNLQLQ